MKPNQFVKIGSLTRTLLIIFLLTSPVIRLKAQPSTNFQNSINNLLPSSSDTSQPAISIAVVKNGIPIYSAALGMANIQNRVSNDANTQFWIASVTKQFTAAAIFKLVSQRKVSLQASVRTFIPELPEIFQPVTLDHLIHHTGGIRDGFVLTALSKKPESEYTNENVIKYLKMQKRHNFTPGTRYEYNNSGYVLLATVIERVSGQLYADFLKNELFLPIGMKHTYVSASFPNNAMQAEGYHATPSGFDGGHFRGNTYGSTGIITTLGDITRWVQFIQQPNSIPNLTAMGNQLLRTGRLSNGKSIAYAGGLEKFTYSGLPVYEHFGSDEGFKANTLYFPTKEVSIIGLTNNGSFYGLQALLYRIADIMLTRTNEQKADVDFGKADSVVYYYNTSVPQLLRLQFHREGVKISNTPSGYAAPYLISADTFLSIDPLPARYLKKDRSLQVLDNCYHNTYVMTRIDLLPPIKKFEKYIGEYTSNELATSYRIIQGMSGLQFEFLPGVTFDLFQVNETDFMFEYVGSNFIQFTEKGFLFSREGIRQLSFNKK